MRRPNGFYQLVMDKMPNVRLSKALIAMVKRGYRKNDAVLMAIIEADHELKVNCDCSHFESCPSCLL